MAFSNVWDDTQPPDTQAASSGALDFRNLKTDIQQRMAAISGLDAAKQSFEAGFAGVVYFATDTGNVYQWSGVAWTNITNDFYSGSVLGRQVSFASRGTLMDGSVNVVIPAALLGPNKHVFVRGVVKYAVGGSASAPALVLNPAAPGFSLVSPTGAQVGNSLSYYSADIYLSSLGIFDAVGIAHYNIPAANGAATTTVNYTTLNASTGFNTGMTLTIRDGAGTTVTDVNLVASVL